MYLELFKLRKKQKHEKKKERRNFSGTTVNEIELYVSRSENLQL